MKKYVSILLTALLLIQTLFVTVSAEGIFNDGQMIWGDCEVHVYDNACDTACNRCGSTRTVPDHVAQGSACADSVCIYCGVAVPASAAHSYDNACDADCNACGAVREVQGHTYDNACDDTCNVCGATRAVKGHVFENDTDTVCNECGAIRIPQEPGEDRTPGDVNGDGVVNNKDLVLILRHMNGWKVQIHITAADVNGDQVLSMKDAARLQQYLNGWNVELI